jgi:protein phosphatase
VSIEVRWGSATHVGRVRQVNQDSVLAGPTVFAVADGMGGHAAGEVASAIAIAELSTLPPQPSEADIVHAVQAANEAIRAQAGPGTGREGMGTTVTGVCVASDGDEESLVVFNVGDSRTYRLDERGLQQLSEDHSLVAELVASGDLDPADTFTHPQRNIVTRALGVDPDVEVDTWFVRPAPGQQFLMCSDGLVDELRDDEVAAVLGGEGSVQAKVDELVARALEAGGRDNVSVVLLAVDSVTDDPASIEEDTNPRGVPAIDGPTAGADATLIATVPGAPTPETPAAGAAEATDLLTGVPSLPSDAEAEPGE